MRVGPKDQLPILLRPDAPICEDFSIFLHLQAGQCRDLAYLIILEARNIGALRL